MGAAPLRGGNAGTDSLADEFPLELSNGRDDLEVEPPAGRARVD
jgi:hypothetical protein